MKKCIYPKVFLAFVCALAFGLTTAARADHGADDQVGGEIEGTESLHVDVMMTPTSAAPAGSAIELKIEAENEHGTTDTEFELETAGLPAGTYTVNYTLKSDGSTATLGTFQTNGEGEGEIGFGEDGDPFPAGFNPFDIATVSVLDANGILLFTADLTGATTGSGSTVNLNATVTAVGGAAAPNATGTATLTAFASKKGKGSLQFSGSGLPANTPVVLNVNGVAAKNLKTDKNGNVRVNLSAKGKFGTIGGASPFDITSVTLTDRSGNVFLTANF